MRKKGKRREKCVKGKNEKGEEGEKGEKER